MFVSGALFGDGAAGVPAAQHAGRRRRGTAHSRRRRVVLAETEGITGWTSRMTVCVPDLARNCRRSCARLGAGSARLSRSEWLPPFGLQRLPVHPGGRKLLETMEEVLGSSAKHSTTRGRSCAALAICRRRRPCSFCDRALQAGARGRYLLAAFGLGFPPISLRRTFSASAAAMISLGAIALLAFVTLQRLAELVWARSNAQRLVAAGAIEYGREHYALMIGFSCRLARRPVAARLRRGRPAIFSRPVRPVADRALLGPGNAGVLVDHASLHRAGRGAGRTRSLSAGSAIRTTPSSSARSP